MYLSTILEFIVHSLINNARSESDTYKLVVVSVDNQISGYEEPLEYVVMPSDNQVVYLGVCASRQ